MPAYWVIDLSQGELLALRLVGTAYEPHAESTGPVTLAWPVAVSFSVGDLAQPRSR